MADEDPVIEGRLLSSLKVTELREELEKRGLPSKGVKKDLQARLKENLASSTEKVPETKESPLVLAYRERQRVALAEQRAADPRNKQKSVSEDQVSSTKPVEQSPQKSDETSNAVQAEPEKQQEDNEAEKEPEPVEHNEVATEKSPSESSNSNTSSSTSSSSSSASSRDLTPEKKKENAPEPVESASKDSDVVMPDSTPNDPLPVQEEPAPVEEEPKKEDVVEEKVEEVFEKKEVAQEEEKADSPQEKPDSGTKTAPEEEEKVEKAAEEVVSDVKEKEEEKEEEEEVKKKEDDDDELDYGDEEEKDVKDETMDTTTADEEEKKKEEKVEKKTEKDEKERGTVSHRRASSPSTRHPISDIIHIRGLVRPFTEKMLRDVVSSHGGEIIDFWMDKVKSHCFIKMSSEESAAKVLKAMHGTHWPESNNKMLSIVHDSDENMTRYKEGKGEVKLPEVVAIGTITGASRAERLSSTSSAALPGRANLRITVENAVRDNSKRDVELKEKRGSLASRLTRIDDKDKEKKAPETDRKRQRSETPPFSRGAGFLDVKRGRLDSDRLKMRDDRREPERAEPSLKTPDELFKKTKTLPALYYLPLTEKQIAEKERRNAKTSRSSTDRPRRDN